MDNSLGLYIHIPFCTSKCDYCNFYSIMPNGRIISDYIKAVCTEITFYKGINKTIDTIYFGGGTPNILNFKDFARILETIRKVFKVSSQAEITIEMNPNLVTNENMQDFRFLGINRASLGVQSFKDGDLAFLRREHNVSEAKEAITKIKTVCQNISIDFIIGLPGQTAEQYEEAAILAQNYGVKHISGYLLKVENGTKFYNKQTLAKLPNDEETANLYECFVDKMNKYGYNQYEISNFAKASYESVHNLKYWECKEYIGIGPSAHSYFKGTRYYVSNDIYSYLKNMQQANQRLKFKKGALPPHLQTREKTFSIFNDSQIYYTEPCDLFSERVMLGLRLNKGVLLKELQEIDGDEYGKFLERLQSNKELDKFLIKNNDRVSLSTRGMLISNYIIATLLY
ncbi:MAG: radical SAM family heme chaperone HemW [Oscillospiraceae bacterium]|nr:radical SAM family heme chaperone HemW [Oscillospiraceae bacterium]